MPINIKMPDGVIVAFPDDMPKKDIQSLILSKYPSIKTDKTVVTGDNEFTKGVKRGSLTSLALIKEGVPAVGKGVINKAVNFFGYPDTTNPSENLKEYQKEVIEANKKYPSEVPSYRDINSLQDLGKYAASSVGEQVPQLALSLLGGAGGSFLGKTGLSYLAKKGGISLTEKQLAKNITNSGIVGTLLASASQNVPESYLGLLEEEKDTTKNPIGLALITGALKTGLDTLTEINILKRILGPEASDIVGDTLLKRFGKEAGKAFITEGVTESAQEGLDVIAEEFINNNKELFSRENVDRLIDAGLKGALAGGVMGSVTAPFGHTKINSPEEKSTTATPYKFNEVSVEDEQVSIDDSILAPLYVPEKMLEQAKILGIQDESISMLSKDQIERAQETLNKVEKKSPNLAYTLDDIYIEEPNTTSTYDDKAFKDTSNIILKGTPINLQATLDNVESLLKIYDNNQLESSLKTKLDVPTYGNIRDDYIIPNILKKNVLKSLDYLQPKQQKEIIRHVNRILSSNKLHPFSNNQFSFKTFEKMPEHPIESSYFLNVLNTSLNTLSHQKINTDDYIEVYHGLKEKEYNGDKEALDKDTINLLPYLGNDNTQEFLLSPEGRKELRAQAFSKWVKTKDTKLLPNSFKQHFKTALNTLERVGNTLKGLDQTYDPILGEILDDINYTNKKARLQRIQESIRREHQKQLISNKTFKKLVKDTVKLQNLKWDSGQQMGLFGRYINSMQQNAHAYPALAPIYTLFEDKLHNSKKRMLEYSEMLGSFNTLDKNFRASLFNLAAYMRETKQKATLDENGALVFKRDGKLVKIVDPEVGKNYMLMQKVYKKTLEDFYTQLKTEAFKTFGEKEGLLKSPNFDLEDVTEALKLADGEVREGLENLSEALISYERLQKIDYVPSMRFGRWGITVRDKKTGKQVAFYTIEDSLSKRRGKGKLPYDLYQFKEVVNKIKNKYSDTSRYQVIDANGIVKHGRELKPFLLTKNSLRDSLRVDSDLLNIEFLGSLLNNNFDNLDQETYGAVKQKVYQDVLTKGFSVHFKESSFIDGYSTDWDRAHHAYLTASAHHLGGPSFQQNLATYLKELKKIKDTNLIRRAESYIKYLTSPAEDLITLRTFNFLWTMGANPSTALLQVMSLPIMTLGSISQFNPNALSNMRRISKWLTIGTKLIPASFIETSYKKNRQDDNVSLLDFTNEKRLKTLIRKGTMTQSQANFLIRASKEGRISGMVTEESIGSKQFETRSKKGQRKALLHDVGSLLGAPITIMEQLTRFATTMSTYELLEQNPKALDRAVKIFSKNPLYKSKVKMHPEKSIIDIVTEMSMDEAHAVFGKLGRPEIMRSYGGAIIIPFMTYTQQAIEFMWRMMATRGKEGRIGGYMAIAGLYFFAGLLGLPGGELLKELLEEAYKQVSGQEVDLDLEIRKKIYDETGSVTAGKFVTQGVGRAFFDLDVSRRIGLPIPGQEILLNLLGIRGDSSDILGVSGSLMGAIADAWREYNTGGGSVKIMSAVTPSAASNVLKAFDYYTNGVRTSKGIQLLTPEEVSSKILLLRAMGITSGEVATKREELYYTKLSNNTYKEAIERYRGKAKHILTKMFKAQTKQDFKATKKYQKDLKNLIDELVKYKTKHDIPLDLKAFIRSAKKAAIQRIDPTIKPKDLKKLGRKHLKEIQKTLGTYRK